jgi:hypothetical protein
MIAMAGAAARNSWAAQKAPQKPAPKPAPQAEVEEEEEGDEESVAPAPAPVTEAPSRTARRRAARAAEPVSDQPASPSTWGRPATINHFGQIGISIMPGTGYRELVPYRENIHCGDRTGNINRRVCTNVLPFFLDLQLAYGVHPRVDLIVDLRVGVQRDPIPGAGHQIAVAPGIRYWVDQGVALKFYVTGQIVYDRTNYIEVSKNDIGLRNADGLMYDPIKNLGFFFQVGWTMGFSRWFRMDLDTGIGVQVRF